jgi:hypothetical protein
VEAPGDRPDPPTPLNPATIATYNILVGKSEMKSSLGRPKCKWHDNIKMDLKKYNASLWTGLISLKILSHLVNMVPIFRNVHSIGIVNDDVSYMTWQQ